MTIIGQPTQPIPTMKNDLIHRVTRCSLALLLAALAILSTVGLKAGNFFTNTIDGITLNNNAGKSPASTSKSWAILALSGGVTITEPSSNTSFYDVIGDVGVAGAGNLSMTLSQIQGTAYLGTGTSTAGASITGGVLKTAGSNTYLNTAVSQATSANTTASALVNSTSGLTFSGLGSGVPSTISLNNTAGSITGAAGGTYVMNLTNLILTGANAVLNFSGSSLTNYIVNVSQYLTLSSAAKITLSGGLTSANVLFNVSANASYNSYNVGLSGGSQLNGIILAPSRTVTLTGASKVTGEVIGKTVSLSGSSQVVATNVSP